MTHHRYAPDPASLAATAGAVRRGALAMEESGSELATLVRLLAHQWPGPEARRARRRLDELARSSAQLGTELRAMAGALHDLATTAAQLRGGGSAVLQRSLERSTATLTQRCESSSETLARVRAGLDRV